MPKGPFVKVTAGAEHACGLRPGGRIACWGRGEYGQRGAVPRVVEQPRSLNVSAGRWVSLTVEGAGDPYPSVRWQVRYPGSTRWVDIARATGTVLTFRALRSMDGDQIRAVFTNMLGASSTNAARLTVGPGH
jgi:hypothetical protein